MIRFGEEPGTLCAAQLVGFFVGWPEPPSPQQLLDVLRGSYRCVYAMDGGHVVGFAHAISDGVLTGYVPWLEVLPSHQGAGTGSALLTRLLGRLGHLYSVDTVCDPELRRFYERFAMRPLQGMGLRNPAANGDGRIIVAG